MNANARPTVRITFEGKETDVPDGATVAAALLATGIASFGFRPTSLTPRGPFCMMGACFECMVEIDGVANCQACLTPVREGQEVRRMSILPTARVERDAST